MVLFFLRGQIFGDALSRLHVFWAFCGKPSCSRR